MALNDVYKQDLYYHANQRQFISTFYWRETLESTDADPCRSVNIAWDDDIRPSFLDLLAGEARIGCLVCRRIVGDEVAEHDAYFTNENGTQSGQAIPGSSALRLNTGANHQGRPNRGGLVISGIAEADMVNGFFSADLTTVRLSAFIDALQAGLTAAGGNTGEWEFGYMSRAGANPGDPAIAWPGTFIDPTVYYSTGRPVVQRSRQGTHTNLPS